MAQEKLLITDTTMTKEYYLAYKRFGLSSYDIIDIVINGIKSAFIPYEIKRSILRKTKDDVIRLINDFSQDQALKKSPDKASKKSTKKKATKSSK